MGRRKTGSKCITDSFSYSIDDVNVILDTEKEATKDGFHSFSSYLVHLMKENLERKKVMDEPEPNSIGIVYNDKDVLETMTMTEQPKGPTANTNSKQLIMNQPQNSKPISASKYLN